jgi:hypothetical protein
LGADARLQYDLTKDTSNFWLLDLQNLFVSKADGSDLGFTFQLKQVLHSFEWRILCNGEAGIS